MGEGEADQECTEVGFEPDLFEHLPTDADGEHEAEQQHQLTVPGVIEHPSVQRSSKEDRRDHDESPWRRCLVDGEGEEYDGKEVLYDQRADRKAALKRAGFIAIFEGLHGEHRAAEREREPDEQRIDDSEVGGEGEPEGTKPEKETPNGKRGQTCMDGGTAPDHRSGERARLQLQADPEQQQQDASIGDVLDSLGGFVAEGVEDEPCGEVTDEGWKPNQ